MNKENPKKKVTSIAIKLNSSFVRKLFVKFLIIDLFILIVIVGYYLKTQELNYYGEFIPKAKRVTDFFPIETATYTVTWSNGKTMIKDISSFLLILKQILIKVIGFHSIFFHLQFLPII